MLSIEEPLSCEEAKDWDSITLETAIRWMFKNEGRIFNIVEIVCCQQTFRTCGKHVKYMMYRNKVSDVSMLLTF